MGKKLKLYGFAWIQSPESVKKFLEEHTGVGSVCDVEVGQREGCRAHAMVEFTTIEAAGYIKGLAADVLLYENWYLKAWDVDHIINNVILNVGCQVSEQKFCVLWCHNNVSVSLGSDTDLRKFNFFLNYNSLEYNLEVSLESIKEIEFRRPQGHSAKFLVIQVIDQPFISAINIFIFVTADETFLFSV